MINFESAGIVIRVIGLVYRVMGEEGSCRKFG
jgi:hypothetical protein